MAKVSTVSALNWRLRGRGCVFDSGLIGVASGGSLVQITSWPFYPLLLCNGGPFQPRVNDRMAPLPLLVEGTDEETTLLWWWCGFRLMINTCKGTPSLSLRWHLKGDFCKKKKNKHSPRLHSLLNLSSNYRKCFLIWNLHQKIRTDGYLAILENTSILRIFGAFKKINCENFQLRQSHDEQKSDKEGKAHCTVLGHTIHK